ncbi:MAG: AAA family ATPase [Methylobacter sp.]
MYSHHKDNKFRHFLRQKACFDDYEIDDFVGDDIDFTQLPEVMKIFDIRKMQAMLRDHDRKSNLYRNHQRYIDYLGDTAGYLQLASLSESIFGELDALGEQFPNFSEAIDFYRHQFALARLAGSGVFAANPLLIAGPPGVGKTAFCQALARIVATHFSLISLSGMTAGFVLGGMSSGWSDGKPGRVVEALARGHFANPLIVLDELDKAGGDKRYDALGPLYQLLEKETSARFVDEALEIPIDCSRIVWIGTANILNLIAEPILSRFTIVTVERPSSRQMAAVLRSIYRNIRNSQEWGSQFSEDLPLSVIRKLTDSGLEPRLLQRELITACGKAVLRKPMGESPCDAGYELHPDDFNLRGIEKQKTTGVSMPIYASAPVAEEPEASMMDWSVREVQCSYNQERTQHLVGYIARRGSGRATSAIQVFDRETMRIKTSSGRVYHLQGRPGFNADAEYVWAHWKKLNGAQEIADVTSEYCLLH